MTTPIGTGPNDLPDVRALNSGRPGSGRSMAALYAALMQGLGFDWLRFATMPVQIGDWRTADTGAASSISSTHYLRFTPSPLAQYVWVGLQCARGLGAASAVLSIETVGGVVVDSGFTLSGEIPRSGLRNSIVFDPVAGAFYPSDGGLIAADVFAHSGWAIGNGATARLLDVGTRQGQALVLKLVVSGVRPYALSLVEAYRRNV